MTLDSPAARLRWARQHHRQYPSGTDAARAFGWKVSTYLGHENGDRTPSRAAAKRYGTAYRVRWEWILEGEGPPTAQPFEVLIEGEVSGNAEIHFYPKDQKRRIADPPPGVSLRTVAVEVSRGSMRGIADDHWLIYFDNEQRPPTSELIGKLCVVELDNGALLIRVLGPGRKRGRYDLEFATLPTMRDQRVRWAARVTWIRPR